MAGRIHLDTAVNDVVTWRSSPQRVQNIVANELGAQGRGHAAAYQRALARDTNDLNRQGPHRRILVKVR